MRSMILALTLAAAVSVPAFAQTTTDTKTPAVATSDTKNANAPVEGKNSFTEAQAKERIEKAGYTAVSGLKLDEKGIWRGTATKDGASTSVALDYQGNVVSQ